MIVGPPPRPSAWQEPVASALFRALAPRLGGRQPRTPRRLAPFEPFTFPRADGVELAATWYPAPGSARGAVLLAPPWHEWGQAYFHYFGRLEGLRDAGYHALTFEPAGVGRSGRPRGLSDRDFEAAFGELRRRAPDLPLHFWGVSFGGYWAHPVLARASGHGVSVHGAFFEDVSPHFIEWSKRQVPFGYPCYLLFQHLLPWAYRYFDLRRHAPHLRVASAAYVSGELDRGVRPAETRELARLAGGEHLVVPGADHLETFQKAREDVLALALRTFDGAH